MTTGPVILGARRDQGVAGDATFLAALNDPYDLTFSSNMRGTITTATPTVTVQDVNTLVTIAGNLGENTAIGVAGNQLLKGGIGALVLSGDNRYSNLTTVGAGELVAQSTNSMGAVRSAVQRLILPLTGTANYSFSFTAPAAFGSPAGTTTLSTTAAPPANTGAGNLQDALNALPSIGGIGGSVSVTATDIPNPSTGAGTVRAYIIEFKGSLAGLAVNAITVATGLSTNPAPAAIAIGSATEVGNTVTIASVAHGFVTGQTITIAGLTPLGYNGTFLINSIGLNSFSYFNPVSGLTSPSITTAGTATPANNAVTIVAGNAGGVTVNAAAALVLDGNVLIGNKVLGLNSGSLQGSGFVGDIEPFLKGHGNIIAINGDSTWGTGETPITLTGTAFNISLAAEATRTLTLNGTIGQAAANSGINKVGAGTVVLAGNAPNTFGANTTALLAETQQTSFVNDGTLALNKTPGMAAFFGPITVGDNIGSGTDKLEIRASEQLPYAVGGYATGAALTVNASGTVTTTAAMSSSTTNEVQAVVSTVATAITIPAGGPILSAPAGILGNSSAALWQAAFNTPGVLNTTQTSGVRGRTDRRHEWHLSRYLPAARRWIGQEPVADGHYHRPDWCHGHDDG